MTLTMKLTLSLSPVPIAVCRLPATTPVPTGFLLKPFFSITRTDDELSVVLPEAHADPTWKTEAGWRMLKVEGPLDFDIVGVVAALSKPLAAANIPIFVISTFDTDYLLVKHDMLNKAIQVLTEQGHSLK